MTVYDEVIVEADGGSRGNPGPAGYGAVVKTGDGTVLAERCAFLGTTTNNVAEYQGLIAGLLAAAELGAGRVEARLDSKLVVEQMSGRWKIKNEQLRPLAQQARELAGRLGVVRYEWIPRARNAHADRLANEAMDGAGEPTEPGSAEQIAQEQVDAGQQGDGQRHAAEQLSLDAVPTEPPGGARAPAAPTNEPPESAPGGTDHGTAGRWGSGPGEGARSPARWSGAVGTPTRLLLLRHGQTQLSAQKRYSGRGDVTLTELGAQQAELAAGRLRADAALAGVPVVSSPLSRATQTARAVAGALGSDVIEHEGLIETDFGAWEGLTFLEAAQRDPEIHREWLSDSSVAIPGGESFDDVQRRVSDALEQLLARHNGNTLVLVSHVTPIKQLLRIGLGVGPQLLFRLHLDLASLSVVEFYPDGLAAVSLVNDTSHLS